MLKVSVDTAVASLPGRALAWNDQGVPDRPRELPSRRITDDLRRRIEAGEWASGQQLPSNAELAGHYGSTRRTVSKALRTLADEGLVEIQANWGTFRA
jgi:DNA-binding GntR family transcriptional regulator